MDFFEAQALARKRSGRLVFLFALAVLGTIVAGYFAFVFITALHGVRATANGGGLEAARGGLRDVDLWQPGALIAVALITITISGLSALGKWLSLRAGGSAVAAMLGGRRIDPRTTDLKERQLLNVVEEMSIASGTPLPEIFVLDNEPGLNAFAAGLTTSDAVVAVTRGTLEKLSRDELQAVVGHEFSHILNGDMRLNLKLTSLLYGILVIALAGQTLIRSLFYVRPGRGGRDKNGGGVVFFLIAVGLALMLVGYIGYFFGRLIQSAVSRQREYLADASSVQFTRNPAGITGALKKIGGHSLGSRLANPAAAQISHSFFAQSFRSTFIGLFATHPPLNRRIRAIDPSFDGTFPEPPAVLDVARDSFPASGLAPTAPPTAPRPGAPLQPAVAVASIGLPTSAHVRHARDMLAGLPDALREAARDPNRAPALLYALLLDADPAIRQRQLALVARHDPASTTALDELRAHPVAPETRLSLVQLSLPAIRELDRARLDNVLGALDELVHADGHVSIFEYALQKVLVHHLQLARKPTSAPAETLGPADVASEIGVVLTAVARSAASDETEAANAFSAGLARQFVGLHPAPSLLPPEAAGLIQLDAALNRLAGASGPVKKRLLLAAGQAIAADGKIHPVEAELLRALAATLDSPMPPIL